MSVGLPIPTIPTILGMSILLVVTTTTMPTMVIVLPLIVFVGTLMHIYESMIEYFRVALIKWVK